MAKHHTINYIEFPADDLQVIKRFYTTVFGWKFTDYGPDYTAFTDSIMDGGFTAGTAIQHQGPLVVLYSDHLEKSLEGVAQNGGQISEPIFKFPGGRRFHFIDPAGNELSVWSDK